MLENRNTRPEFPIRLIWYNDLCLTRFELTEMLRNNSTTLWATYIAFRSYWHWIRMNYFLDIPPLLMPAVSSIIVRAFVRCSKNSERNLKLLVIVFLSLRGSVRMDECSADNRSLLMRKGCSKTSTYRSLIIWWTGCSRHQPDTYFCVYISSAIWEEVWTCCPVLSWASSLIEFFSYIQPYDSNDM